MKRICQLKLSGIDKAKDPTIVNQAKKNAEDIEKSQRVKVDDSDDYSNRKPQVSGNENEYLAFLRSNPLFDFCADKICLKGINIVSPPLKLFEENQNITNMNEIKELFTQANGLVLDTADVQIQYQSEFQTNTARIAMQFESKKGTMSNVSLTCAIKFTISSSVSSLNLLIATTQGRLYHVLMLVICRSRLS